MKTKLGLMLLLIMSTIGLAACGKNPQTSYIDYLEKIQTSETFKTTNFKVGIKELSIGSEKMGADQEVSQMKMALEMVKNIEISGKYVLDEKKSNLGKMDLSFKVMGAEIPLEMVTDGKTMYLSTDYLSSIFDLAGAFTSELPIVDLSTLKGKYLDVQRLSSELDAEKSKEIKEADENTKVYSEEVSKQVLNFLKSKKSEDFKEKDDIISYSYSEDDFEELMKIMQEIAETKPEYEAFKATQDYTEIFKYMSLSLDTRLNTKENKMTSSLTIQPKGKKSNMFDKIVLSIKTTYKESGATIKLPSKEQIIKEDEMNQLMTEVKTQEETYEESIVPEADFEGLLEVLEENKDSFSEAEIDELFDVYSEILTPEQLERFKEVLK